MAFCKKCGIKLDDDALFCPSCGTPVIKTKKSTKEKPDIEPEQTNLGGTALHTNLVYGKINIENLPENFEIDKRYIVKQKLGQGSFGAVYRVFDKDLETDKALKIIPEAISNDKEAMMSLRKEAAIMVKLNHKNIVRVYDFHHTGDIKYIDMEYVQGENLADIKLKRPDRKFPEEEVRDYAVQTTEALAYAHNKKVIHKDIKPQNIMLSNSGEIKIMDFGIAETVHSSMSRLKNTGSSGTLVYMSPEQLRGKDVGREADIYSLGATMYELLSGNPPFHQGDITYQIINEQAADLKGVSENINAIIQKCLAKDKTERFLDCDELHEALLNNKILETKIEEKEAEKLLGKMVFVKGGTFQMGSNNGDNDGKPVHTVTVSDFYIGKHEVTQKQWEEIMGNNPSHFKGDNLPVEKVSWNDIQKFIKKLNAKIGKNYRLPTEAEWEYAARGGNQSNGYKYSGSNNIDDIAWYGYEKSEKKTHSVGTKQANELGIYNMSGNVWEWCSDWYGKNYYSNSPQYNPQGPSSGSNRVYRGGSWDYNTSYCRVVNRNYWYPDYSSDDLGFRLAFSL